VQSRTSVGVYAERVVRPLLQIDPDNEYTHYVVEDGASLAGSSLKKGMITGYTTMGRNRFWEHLDFTTIPAKCDVDLNFSPTRTLLFILRWR